MIPKGLAGAADAAGASQPDLVPLTPTVQESWTAGLGVAYASGESVMAVAGGIQIAGFSGNLALNAVIVDSSSTPPENYYGTGSLASLIDGGYPSSTDGRAAGWVSYNNKTATAVVEFDDAKLIEKVRVYLKTDTTESSSGNWVYYPDEVAVFTSANADIDFVTQAVLDLRGWELEDTARWVEVELPGGVAARRVAVRMRSRSGSWMSVGEIEVLQDGYNASGYVLSNGFDLGAEGLLSVQWEAARPANTSVDFKIRSGDTPSPDGSWTAYTSVGQNAIVDPALRGRYVEYRADLRTGLANNYNVTPILTRVRFNNLQRIYYTGDDGSSDRILSAISLDGLTYSSESGARVEPGGTFSGSGVSDPVFVPVSGGTALGNLSSIQESLSNLTIDATCIQLVPVYDTNYAASSQGTTVLWDEDRYNDSYLAQYGIEGDHGANRASRYAGRDAGGPIWTIDFDLGQERQLGGVQMLRHDSSYEVTGFKVYGATVYSTTSEDDYTGFSLFYDSPTYAAGTDHAGCIRW